jgi:hypothetical protein
MARVLNHEQFKEIAAETNALNPDWGNESGATVKLQQGSEGEIQRPVNVNMVGGVVPTESHGAPLEPRKLVQFSRHHQELLDQTDMFLGTWHEGNRQPEPEVDLDVSQSHGRDPSGRMDARVKAIGRGEKAYGEIDEAGDYQTHVNPFSTPKAKDKKEAIPEWHKRLTSDPESYARVVGGDVLGAMSSWVRR